MPHINELYDYTITVFVVNESRVLLVNHPRYNKWIPIGGHIELDEDPDTALFREIKEETGLSVEMINSRPEFTSADTKHLITPNYVDVHEANLPHRHISFIYFGVATNADYKMSDEHSDMRWFSVKDLDIPKYKISAAIKFYAREALKLAAQ